MTNPERDDLGEELLVNQASLTAELLGLRKELREYARSTELTLAALQDEIETRTIVSRFARRGSHWMLVLLLIATSLVADLARGNATNGWWGLLFWTTQHGAGGAFEWLARSVGLFWQVGLVWYAALQIRLPLELRGNELAPVTLMSMFEHDQDPPIKRKRRRKHR